MRKTLLTAVAFALLQNPVAGLLNYLLFGKDYVRGFSLTAFALASALGAIPLVIVFLGASLLRSSCQSRLIFLPNAFLAAGLLLSFGGQLFCWYHLASDAQASLLFLFLPLYSTAILAVLLTILIVITAFLNRRNSTAP